MLLTASFVGIHGGDDLVCIRNGVGFVRIRPRRDVDGVIRWFISRPWGSRILLWINRVGIYMLGTISTRGRRVRILPPGIETLLRTVIPAGCPETKRRARWMDLWGIGRRCGDVLLVWCLNVLGC